MGVSGLLPALKSVTQQVHVTKFAGKTVGIDAAGWLYRGAYSCAADVVLHAKDADGYLNYCVEQIKLLREHDVTPVFVFDGAPLPAKAELNAARNRARQVWKTKALRQLDDGDESGSHASFTKALAVSNDMIRKFIAVLRRLDVAFYVAPYEADAQLAFFSRHKLVDVVMSEDSDCVPYGCRTMLFKWTPDGWGSELKRRSLGANEEFSFVDWTEEMFIQLCVLCGCDYCPSVPGVGIVTAYKLVNAHKTPIKVVQALQEQKQSAIPPNYAERFYSAIVTFRHHLVFDPRDKKMKMLNPLTLSKDILPFVDKGLHFLGDIELRDETVALIASGDIHPSTLDSYDWKDAAEALNEQQLACLAAKPSAHSLTSTESSLPEKAERNHVEYDDQSSRCTIISESDEGGAPREAPPRFRSSTAKSSATRASIAREDREQPKPASSSSWGHLGSLVGGLPHIEHFRSPKVSENFRPLVSQPNNAPAFHSGATAREMKEFETQSVRQSVKRIKNPKKRRREGNGSGFDGEVLCRIDSSSASYRRPTSKVAVEETNAAEDGNGDDGISEQDRGVIGNNPVASSFPKVIIKQLKRPAPFAFQAASAAPQPEHRNGSSIVSSSSADSRSEVAWKPRAPFLSSASGSPRGYSSYARAAYAEEKWDRILGAEIDVRSESESSQSQMQIVHSQTSDSVVSNASS